MEEKLKELRKRWLKEPHNRKIIELQARALKMGKKKNKNGYEWAKRNMT